MDKTRSMPSSIGWGLLLGGIFAAPLAALFHLGRHLAGLPFPPFDLFDGSARVLPGGIITSGIEGMVK